MSCPNRFLVQSLLATHHVGIVCKNDDHTSVVHGLEQEEVELPVHLRIYVRVKAFVVHRGHRALRFFSPLPLVVA